MRTALILSGQPRLIKENFHNIKDIWITPNDADLFCFFWDQPELYGQAYTISDCGNNRKSRAKREDVKDFVKSINPKRYCFQEQIDFNTNPAFFEKYENYDKEGVHNFYSWTYSWRQALLLLESYEQEHNFKYDLIIRTRTDHAPRNMPHYTFLPDGKIAITERVKPTENSDGFKMEPNENAFNYPIQSLIDRWGKDFPLYTFEKNAGIIINAVTNHPHNKKVNHYDVVKPEFYPISDHFAFGDRESMGRYLKLFDSLSKYYKKDNLRPFNIEVFLGYHIYKQKIQYDSAGFDNPVFR